MRDLFPGAPGETRTNGQSQTAGKRQTYSSVEKAAADFETRKGTRCVQTWSYQNGCGEEVLRVARFDDPNGKKTYRPFHPAEGGWVMGDPPGLLPLYRLPELREADLVLVTEGEKCADAAVAMGFVATTSAHGSKSAHKTDFISLSGKHVVVLPDNDQAGASYASDVTQILAKLAVPPRSVRVLRLPGLPAGGDIVDFVEARPDPTPGQVFAEISGLVDEADTIDLSQAVSGLDIVRLSDVTPTTLEWLWLNRIPLGKLTLLVGDPGLGKSFLTLDIAARVTKGRPWPDRPDGLNTPGDVILLSAEDDLSDTIQPRLKAAGANLERVHAIRMVRTEDGPERLFSLQDDVVSLGEELRRRPDVRLIVIDPISAYLGARVDANRNTAVRSLLAPLADMAARHGVAVVAVSHLNKAAGKKALYRAMDSLAFVATARAVWLVSRDEKDHPRRFLLPAKMNLAADVHGLAFRLEDGVVVWEIDSVDLTADEALASEAVGIEPESKVEEAAEWLRGILCDGPLPASEIEELAKKEGLAWRTVERAKRKANVASRRDGFGKGSSFIWELDRHDRPPTPVEERGLAVNGEGGGLCDNGVQNGVSVRTTEHAVPIDRQPQELAVYGPRAGQGAPFELQIDPKEAPEPETPVCWARLFSAMLSGITDSDRRVELREQFEERAAICEYDGCRPRDEAEREAFQQVAPQIFPWIRPMPRPPAGWWRGLVEMGHHQGGRPSAGPHVPALRFGLPRMSQR